MRRYFALLWLCAISFMPLWAQAPVTLTFDQPQTAGISGFRTFWDLPVVLDGAGAAGRQAHIVGGNVGSLEGPVAYWAPDRRNNGTQPGALVFDAVHRSLLVRFPGCAEAIAAKLAAGYAITRMEVELPFINTELWPEGYDLPAGMSFLRDEWVKQPPNWHAVAWALRKPWQADPELGPTYNAAINGAVYWGRFGAEDEKTDRYPHRFGPVEVSYRQATNYQGDQPPAPVVDVKSKALCTPDTPAGGTPARLDVTLALTDPAFGKTPAARLRQFADCGLLLRKEEVYDTRYHTGTYEWSVATGRRGILIRTPRLIVTLAPVAKAGQPGKLPPAADIAALAHKLKGTKAGGRPTAVMPTAEEITALAARFRLQRPAGMPDWQWQRLQELKALGGGWDFPATPDAYAKWIDSLLACSPRQWLGHQTPRKAINALRYGAALPAPVLENEKRYFEAWAMPWMRTENMDHPQAIALWYGGRNKNWEETRDWRGNQSYYRAGYTRRITTQNINHSGAAGALFGGRLVGSEYAMADGRYGLENFPLRLWAWSDGTTQESIDHYYFALTLWVQKEFADFGPTQLDRLMGQSMLSKSMDEVISCYHPGLRRFIAPTGRSTFNYLLATQAGLQYVMHSLSRSGAMTDLLDNKPRVEADTFGMPVLGDSSVMPGDVADDWLVGPWAPAWAANMVDDKPLPYEMTAVQRPYPHTQQPEYQALKCSYLGHHYGLMSIDSDTEGAYRLVQAAAQWRRTDRPVETMKDLGTMIVRPEADERCLDWYGGMQWTDTPPIGGLNANVQYKNILLALTSPVDMRNKVAPHSLQTALGFCNFQPNPTWEIYVDGQPVKALPFTATAKQHITICDGVTYVGLTPVPATDLGRDAEIVLSAGVKVEMKPGAFPGLTVRNYMLKRDAPLDKNTADFAAIDRAFAGFVIEMGDAAEYPDFAAFQRHIAAATLETRWDQAAGIAHLKYTSGNNVIEVGYNPTWSGGPTTRLFPYRRVNGGWPWPQPGIDRDTTLSQQGNGGKLEKGGAVLRSEPGRMAYLQTEPISGMICAWNPLPDPTYWTLALKDGARIEADGRLGLLRVEMQPGKNRLAVEYALKADQISEDMASALLVFGMPEGLVVTVNGAAPRQRVSAVRIGAETALAIPLGEKPVDPRTIVTRYTAMLPLRAAAFARTEPATGVLRVESDTYLYSVPRSGVHRFQHLWPTESVIDARTPDGIRVATDGRVALLRLDIDTAKGIVDLDLPVHEQNIKELKARALLIFGFAKSPVVVLQGKSYAGPVGTVTIGGQTAYVVPLYGEALDAVLPGLAERFAAAQAKLADAEAQTAGTSGQ